MRHKFKRHEQICLTWITILAALAAVSCNGQDFGFLQPTPQDLCKCLPIEPDIADYRHAAKHVAIATSQATMIHAHDGASVCEVGIAPWWRRRLAYAFAFPGVTRT